MYAIIETGGKQYWVKPGQNLQVEKLDAEVGANVDLKVLWAANEEGTSADAKAGNTAKVTAQVVKHPRFQKETEKRLRKNHRPQTGFNANQNYGYPVSITWETKLWHIQKHKVLPPTEETATASV